jgi:3-deoxy-D-manno-octulosonic-acid transferase
VVSSTTPAGRQQAERLIPGARAWFYFPFDFLPCVALALSRIRPTAVAAVETEIWPNWLWLARVSGLRTAMVNGQFADKGFRGARKARWLYGWALSQLDVLAMQTRQAAERALFLGAPAERVRVVGNAKFEQGVLQPKPEAADTVTKRLQLDDGRPLWIAGSTHPGEEEQVLEAFRLARERLPELALLLAPRHVERAEDVLRVVREAGWRAARRSEAGTETVDVLVLDTMGELAGLYALAEVVFVGGSLVPVGGHDILQPLFQRKPALFGPHMHYQRDLADLELASGAAMQTVDPRALADAVVSICTDGEKAESLRRAGETLLRENQGAAGEYARILAG